MKLITFLLFTSKAANTIYMVNADEREYKLKIILFSQARGSECLKRQTAAVSNVNCNYITTVCREFLFWGPGTQVEKSDMRTIKLV
jgi:hypothetical protein